MHGLWCCMGCRVSLQHVETGLFLDVNGNSNNCTPVLLSYKDHRDQWFTLEKEDGFVRIRTGMRWGPLAASPTPSPSTCQAKTTERGLRAGGRGGCCPTFEESFQSFTATLI